MAFPERVKAKGMDAFKGIVRRSAGCGEEAQEEELLSEEECESEGQSDGDSPIG